MMRRIFVLVLLFATAAVAADRTTWKANGGGLFTDAAANEMIQGDGSGDFTPTDHATDDDAHHAATVAGDLDIEDLASNMETTDICTGDGAQGLTCGDSIRLGGTIAGNVVVTSDGTGSTLGTDECQGDLYILTASITMVLPEVTGADGYNCCFYGTGANALTIDPNAADEIILDGTAIGTGDAIVSTGAAGDKICVTNHAATGWITSGKAGTWADESP